MLPYYEERSCDYAAFEWHHSRSWGLHLHHQIEIMFVRTGQMDVQLDSEIFRLSHGDMAVAVPNCIHGYTQVINDPGNEQFQGLVLSPSLAGEFCDPLVRSTLNNPIIRAAQITDDIRYAFEKLFAGRDTLSPMMARAYLQLLISLLWPLLDARPRRERTLEDTPHRLIRYVVEHHREPIQAKDVAKAVGISPSHLARVFRGSLRMSFSDYINQLRVETARDMLNSTDLPITTIMEEVGFDSQTTFNRVFREICHASPRQYRANHRKERDPTIVTPMVQLSDNGNNIRRRGG